MSHTGFYTAEGVRYLVRQRAREVGSVAALARKWCVQRPNICSFLIGRRGPPPEVLRQLGLEESVTYIPVPRAP